MSRSDDDAYECVELASCELTDSAEVHVVTVSKNPGLEMLEAEAQELLVSPFADRVFRVTRSIG